MICFFLYKLNDLVTLVRGNLTKLARMILGALIVIEVLKFNMYMWPFNVTPTWLYSIFYPACAQRSPKCIQPQAVSWRIAKERKRSQSCTLCVGQIYVTRFFPYFFGLAWNTFFDQSLVTINVFRSSEVRGPNQCSGRPWVRIPSGTQSILFVSPSYHFRRVIIFLVLLQLDVEIYLQNIAWGSMCSPGLIVLCSVGSCLWCGGKDDIWKRKKCEWFWMD